MGCGKSRRLQQPTTTCNYHYIQQGQQQYGASPCGGYGGYGAMPSYGMNPCGGGYGGYGGYY